MIVTDTDVEMKLGFSTNQGVNKADMVSSDKNSKEVEIDRQKGCSNCSSVLGLRQ